MTDAAQEARILRGMTQQLEMRRARLAAGEKPLGWKVGFGAPAVLAKLGLSGPLIGFLLQSGRLPSGATVALSGWTKPAAEPEIAIYLARDLAGEVSAEEAQAAIGALGPAIELVDVHTPPDDVETILTSNIFQRHVVLGAADPAYAGGKLAALSGRVFHRGTETRAPSDLQENTGRHLDILRSVARTLGQCGEKLRAGDIIITGSVVPPLYLDATDASVEFALDPISRVGVSFTPG